MIRPAYLILLAAISIILYANSIQNTFVYDDVFTVTDNYFIRDLHNFSALFTGDYFKYSGEVTYRPVVTLSYFIDYAIWKLNPLGYHLTNSLIHTANVILVCLLISSVIRHKTIPFLAGIIFALHPVLTEAVDGISYREDLLAAFFFLGSILLFIQLVTSNPQTKTRSYLYPISLLLYLFALCSKEMAITLPLIIFLIDGIKRNTVKYYVGFILVSGFYLFLRFVWFHNPIEKQLTYPGDSFYINMLTMPKVFCSYIKLLFLPVHFNAEYIVTHTRTPLAAAFICSMVFICTIGVMTYRFYNHSRHLFFFTAWFLVTLAPTMNVIPIANIMAERYLYLPSVGFCVILAYILTGIWSKTSLDIPHLSKTVPITCLVLIIVIPYSLATIMRNKVWKNPFTFWSKTVEDSPDSSRAHNNLGMIYQQEGKINLAIHEFQTAIAIESDPEYHHNLGMAYQKKGMKDAAMQEYHHVLAVNPDSALTHNNMGNILIDLGRLDEGISRFKEAIRLKPNYYDAHYNLGLAYFKKGLLDASIDAFKLAIHYEPDHAEAHSCLGTAYANKGLFDAAIIEIEEALRQKPDYPNACKNLGIIHLNYKKDIQKAFYFFNEFLRLDPKNIDAEMIRKTVEGLLASQRQPPPGNTNATKGGE